jgi:hypothetical protein
MKTLLLMIAFMLFCWWGKSQEWQPLGQDFFNQPSPGYASEPCFAIDGQGNLYISYWDYKGTYKATVRKYENGKWGPVGPVGFSDEFANVRIAVAPDGTVYAVGGIAGALVSRFNGTSWEAVGSSSNNFSAIHIAVAADGTPYLAALDQDHGNRATVLKLSGDTWQTVGQAGFTGTPIDNITINIAPDGTPYVTCMVISNGYKDTVMRFTDGAWQTVGPPQIHRGAYITSLAISGDGIPYLAFTDSMNHYKATVMKLEDNNWQLVGDEGFSAGFATPDIALDKGGTPYVAYIDSTIGRRLIVKRFNGSNWETAGNAGFSGFDITGFTILTAPSGTPYVAYADRVTSVDEYLYKVRVMKLEGDTWKSIGSNGVSGGIAAASALAIAPDGTPYMVYTYESTITLDFQNWHKTKVVKWENGTWANVGDTPYFKGIEYVRLAIAPDGIPYLAYNDSANNNQISVIKLEGSDWEAVGRTGINESFTDFAIDSSGTPYIALMTNVLKFDGNNWDPVSAEGFTDNPVYAYMATDKSGRLYVAYLDANNGAKIIVKKLDGTAWQDMSNGIEEGEAYPVLFSIDANNNLNIAFTVGNNTIVKFMRFNGAQWVNLKAYFTQGPPTSIAMDRTGMFYISHKDELNRGKIYVLRFNGSDWEPVGNQDVIAGGPPFLKTDREGNLFMVFNNGGIWAYKYEHPLVLNCPENDTLFNDTGTMVARRSYNALPEGIPDTMAVYSVEGKESLFRMISPLAPQQWR